MLEYSNNAIGLFDRIASGLKLNDKFMREAELVADNLSKISNCSAVLESLYGCGLHSYEKLVCNLNDKGPVILKAVSCRVIK